MGLIDVARDTLKEIPMADILRERLSLALDQSATYERQIADLQQKVGQLTAQLQTVTADYNTARSELKRLEDEHAEDVRIHSAIEFRKGKRTGGKWMAFCPKCHMPAAVADDDDYSIGCSTNCGWVTTGAFKSQLPGIISQL